MALDDLLCRRCSDLGGSPGQVNSESSCDADLFFSLPFVLLLRHGGLYEECSNTQQPNQMCAFAGLWVYDILASLLELSARGNEEMVAVFLLAFWICDCPWIFAHTDFTSRLVDVTSHIFTRFRICHAQTFLCRNALADVFFFEKG